MADVQYENEMNESQLEPLAESFFKILLSSKQFECVLRKDEMSLKRIAFECGEFAFSRTLREQSMSFFRSNYQKMINSLFHKSHSPLVNNLSLHFILISSYLLIAQEQKCNESKEWLKRSWDYVECPNVDAVLLAIALNNLATIQYQRQRFYKALAASTKAISIMEGRIKLLKSSKLRDKIVQEMVLLIAILVISKKCLLQILKINKQSFYKHFHTFVNYLGSKYSLKYLGNESHFAKYFDSNSQDFYLPIYKVVEQQPQKVENSQQNLIIKHLESIYEVLKSKKDPEIIIVNTSSNQSEQRVIESSNIENTVFKSHQQSIEYSNTIGRNVEPKHQNKNAIIENLFKIKSIPVQIIIPPKIQPQKEEELEKEVCNKQMSINNWQILLKLIKDSSNQQVGVLNLNTTQKKKKKMMKLSEEKLVAILALINLEDKLPYEMLNDVLRGRDLVQSIYPFLSVNEDGESEIYPRCKGLMEPIEMKFLNQNSYVFTNHIRFNCFRLAIAPLYSANTIYLNIEFTHRTLNHYFQFEETIHQQITNLYAQIHPEEEAKHIIVKHKNKINQIVEMSFLIERIKEIVTNFNHFILHQQEETAIHQIIESDYCYYKYQEIQSQTKGTFFFVRFLPSLNGLNIYFENDFQTHCLTGTKKAKGHCLYKQNAFRQAFGIPIKYSKKKIMSYIEIILKKYKLEVFNRALTENDIEKYTEDAGVQTSITENTYEINFFKDQEGYFYPITISLLTINSQIPVGIKVQAFHPIQTSNSAFFIHIVPQEWKRPFIQNKTTPSSIFIPLVDQYDFDKNYFIGEWLKKYGFQLIFSKLSVPNHIFNIKAAKFQFFKSTILFQVQREENQIT